MSEASSRRATRARHDALVVRGLLSRWIEAEPGLQLVGSMCSGREAVEQLERANPDVVILDVDMPDTDGIEALPQLLPQADFVVVAVPKTKETLGLLGPAALKAMKPGAGLVSIGRLGIVDEATLMDLLESGHLSGAVYDIEDPHHVPSSPALWSTRNLMIMPHSLSNDTGQFIVNAMDVLARYIERTASDADFVVESERLDSIYQALGKIRSIVDRIGEMAVGGQYDTREYLPGTRMADLSAPDDQTRPIAVHDSPPLTPGLRILVVDDDLGICHSLRDLLVGDGCTVAIATSTAEAMRRLEEQPVDLVLSDVVMPDADGYDLLLQVRERYPDVPVVLMTAFYYDRDHVIKRSKLHGLVSGVIFKKPIDPDKLREIIRVHCRRQPHARLA